MAGRRLIGCSMELGGKNAAIVLPDADIERTVRELAAGSYANAGQTCVAMERVYVHESIRDEFTRRFVEYSASMPMTASFDFSSELSSLIDQTQMERVHSDVEDAVARGATLLTGGKPRPDVGPLFYAAAVLTDVTEEMSVCRQETFGPVTAIYGYTDISEAVRMANDSELGLHFSLWTRDTTGALDIASQLEGILKFTEPQTVATQRLIPAYSPFAGISPERYTRLVELLTKVFKRLPFYK